VSVTPGDRPACFGLGDVCIVPNICYESVLSHLIRRQVNELKEAGNNPQILINLTNDGWFWGSSELDTHLACGVFRAVECRKPFLVAANTGISAWIDGDGRIRAEAARHTTDSLLAEVSLDARESLYLRYGDWFAGVCLAMSVVFAVGGGRRRKGGRRKAEGGAGAEETLAGK
jgi:apolipoprotein N-acyltransferase